MNPTITIDELLELPKQFTPVVTINEKEGLLEIMLDDCSCHAEWIEGEHACVAIYRSNQTGRVVGAMLPIQACAVTICHI